MSVFKHIADGISNLRGMYVVNDFLLLITVHREVSWFIVFVESVLKYLIYVHDENHLFLDIIHILTFFHQFLIDFLADIF